MPAQNVVEIIVSAKDVATKPLADISRSIAGVGVQATLAGDKISDFGSGLVKAASSEVISKFEQISNAVVSLGQKAPSALVATGKGFLVLASAIQSNSLALEAFQNGIAFLEKDLIGTKRSLVDIKDALIDTAKLFSGLNLNDKARNNLISTIKGIESVAVNQNVLKASDVVKKFANELSFKAGQKTGNFLADVAEGFEKVSDKAGGALSKAIEFTKNLAIVGLSAAIQVSPSEIKNLARADIDELSRVSKRVKELAKEDIEAFLGLPFDQIKELAQEDFSAIAEAGEKIKGKLKSVIGEDQFNGIAEKATDAFDRIFSGFFTGTQEGVEKNVKAIEASVDETLQTNLGRKLATVGLEAGQKIASGIGGAVNGTLNGIDKLLDNIEKRVDKIRNVQQFSGFVQQVTLNPSQLVVGEELGRLGEESTKLLGALGNIGQEIFFLTYGVQQFAQVFSAPYEAFIGQNIKLQETLLATQSQIVATNKVFKNGIELTNATEAIKSLGTTSRATIDKIRTDSLALVGVTSQDLIQQLLPVVTRNLAQLGGQLGDVPSLVTSLGASLGTLGLPLFQASQELTSIATGTIDINSQLAKSLNLTNQQVALYKQQGTLIPQLTARLRPFVEGNALAAATIGGVSSNLTEVFQLITQKSGETFLDPIVARLNDVYKLVDPQSSSGIKNFKAIQDVVTSIAKSIFDGVLKLADGIGATLKAIAPAIAGFIQVGARTIGDLLGFVGDTLTALANGPLKFLGAALGALSQYAEVFTGIFKIGLFLKIREVVFGLAVGGLGLLVKTLPIVGTLFGLFALRSNEAALALTNLRSASNTSVSSLLTFGKNINFIPGAVEGVSRSIPLFGASIAQILPQISQFGIALIALGQKFPIVGAIFQSLDTAIPKIVAGLARIAIAFIETSAAAAKLGASVGVLNVIGAGLNTAPIIAGLEKLTTGTKVSTLAINTFGKSVGTLRTTIVSTFTSFAVSSAIFFGIFKLFEQFQPIFEEIGKAAAEAFKQISFVANAVVESFKNPVISALALGAAFAYLVPIILSFKAALVAAIATQITGFITATAATLGGLTTASVAATGGVSKLATALQAVNAASGIEALKIAFLQLGPIIASALLPLGLIIAGLGTIAIKANEIRQADEIQASNTDINQSQNANNRTFTLLNSTKKAKEEELKATAAGLRLTKEQYAENEKLQKQVEIQIAAEESRKAGLEKRLPSISDSTERAGTETRIKEAADSIEKLRASAQSIAIAAKELPIYGSALEQFSRNVENAKKALAASAGDPTVFKQQIEALIEGSQQLQEAGLITADEAAKTYADIAANTSTDAQTQIKAQQAITEAYKKESQRRIDIYDTQTKRIQALLATGKVSESEANALTTQLALKKSAEERDALEKAFQKRKEISDRTTQDAIDKAKRDQAIADAKIAAAKGDPTSLAEVKSKQLGDVDRDRESLDAKRKVAQEKLDELKRVTEPQNGGTRSLKSTEEIAQATENVRALQDQLDKLDRYRDTLDKTVKVDKDAIKDIKDLPKQIEEAQKNLEAFTQGRKLDPNNIDASQLSREAKDRLKTKAGVGGSNVTSKEFLDQLQIEKGAFKKDLEDRQNAVAFLKARLAAAQKAVTPDEKAEASARAEKQAATDEENKTRLAKEKSQAEEKRKLEKAIQDSIAEDQKIRAEAALKILDSRIKETLQAEKVGETNRLAQIAQLRSKGIILESEFKRRETAERKRSIDIELQLEQQKRKEIEKLKKQGKGPGQEIENANLIKIGELVKNKADVEAQFIGDLVSELRDRLTIESQKYAVTIEQQNLKLERQKLLYNALEKGLENQNRLAESANKLGQSMIALKESEFNALNKIFDRQQAAIRKAGGEGNFADLELEEKKLILAEKLAVLKLNALKQQQKFEAESLEREIQKNDLALERKKIENEIAIAKKKIDIAAQDVAIKSAELEVKLRPQSEEAKLKLAQAKLGQDKNFLELGGLQQEKGFIGDEARVNDLVNNNKRRDLANTQEGQTNSALGELIAATRDPAKQEELQARLLTRLTGSSEGESSALTTTDIEAAFNAGAQSVSVRGASFKKPTSALLGQVEQNNTFTAAPAPKPDNTPFATSFEELARKYPDKGGVGSFDELNRKYPDKAAASFDELNKKYAEAEVKPEQAIVSSFDKLSKEIDQGFANVLVAPDLKVKELTAGLEAEFERVSKKITENPVKLTIDEDRLKQVQKDLSKPLAVFDEKQLERLEGIVGALGKGETNIANSKLVGAAAGGNITINAPTTINEAQQKAGNSREEFVNVFNDILKKVGQVTAGVK